jgi:hypothetical protein
MRSATLPDPNFTFVADTCVKGQLRYCSTYNQANGAHCRGRARPTALLHNLTSRKGNTAAPFCDGQRRHDPLRIVFGAQRLDAFPQIPWRPHARTIVLCRRSGSLHITRITTTGHLPLATIAASAPPPRPPQNRPLPACRKVANRHRCHRLQSPLTAGGTRHLPDVSAPSRYHPAPRPQHHRRRPRTSRWWQAVRLIDKRPAYLT